MKTSRARASFWRDRPVLVTGGAGFIGYALATKLAALGARVYVLDIKRTLPNFVLAETDVRGKITYTRGNVTSKKLVDGILKRKRIRTVFHLAAETIVGRAEIQPARTLETNVKGTWVVLESARKASTVREVVIASSDKAYGSQAKLPYREDASLQGMHPYDCSKSCMDLIAQMYTTTYAMPVAIARSGNVYGPGDTNWSRLMPDAFRSIARNRVLDIRSDGTYRRDYIYVNDVVDAYLGLAEHVVKGGLSGEAFNFGNNKPLRVTDALREISRVSGLQYRILNTARNEIQDQYLDTRKATRILGWRTHTPFREGIRRTSAWYSEFFKHAKV